MLKIRVEVIYIVSACKFFVFCLKIVVGGTLTQKFVNVRKLASNVGNYAFFRGKIKVRVINGFACIFKNKIIKMKKALLSYKK